MNCKPGDLAVIIRGDGDGFYGFVAKLIIGKIVRVTNLSPPSNKSACTSDVVWKFEKIIKVNAEGRTVFVDGIDDRCLKPIRDPGDDARDETLEWLPVHSKEKEHA